MVAKPPATWVCRRGHRLWPRRTPLPDDAVKAAAQAKARTNLEALLLQLGPKVWRRAVCKDKTFIGTAAMYVTAEGLALLARTEHAMSFSWGVDGNLVEAGPTPRDIPAHGSASTRQGQEWQYESSRRTFDDILAPFEGQVAYRGRASEAAGSASVLFHASRLRKAGGIARHEAAGHLAEQASVFIPPAAGTTPDPSLSAAQRAARTRRY